MKRRTFLATLTAGLGLVAASPVIAFDTKTTNLEIRGAFARATPKTAKSGVGFMTIRSLGAADRLLAFRSPACERPELHTHIMDGGMMRMRQVKAVDIPAGGEVILEPGGLHMMFIDLIDPLTEGEDVAVTLVFEKAGEVAITLPVHGPGAMQKMKMSH